MWIYLSESFLSVVQDSGNRRRLLVRARFPGDIERVFPELAGAIAHTPEHDYAFRVTVSRARVARAMAAAARAIDYPNFKASIPAGDAHDARHRAYLDCWMAMRARQGPSPECEPWLFLDEETGALGTRE